MPERNRSLISYQVHFALKVILLLFLQQPATSSSESLSYVDLNLTQTLVDVTKENLLRAFGLNLNSKPNKPVVPHDYMIQVFSKLDGQRREGEQDDVNTVRGFVDNGRGGIHWLPFPHLNVAFSLRGIPNTDKLISSELRILQMPSEMNKVVKAHKIRAGRLLTVQLLGKMPRRFFGAKANSNETQISDTPRIVALDSFTLDPVAKEPKWITFNVGNFVETLRSANVETLRFMIRVTDSRTGLNIPPHRIGIRKSGRQEKEKPLLVLYIHDISSSRLKNRNEVSLRSKRGTSRRGKKRDQKRQRRRRNKNLCRRRAMYVSFDDFGWTNWIIAPKGYQAYHCAGSCSYPIAAHLNPTNHATIQSIINSMDPSMVPPACCVPDKLSSISILYLDGNDRVVYKRQDDTVVESCGCK